MKFLKPILIAWVILCSFSCEEDTSILGKPGEVLTVISKDYWESDLGQTLRDSLTAEYPMLPQIEKRFDLTYVSPSGFTSMFQQHRNIIRIDIDLANKNEVVVRKNIWARPQCVIDIRAKSYNEAIDLIKKDSKLIINAIEDAERERLIDNNKEYSSDVINYEVQKLFNGSIEVPRDYRIMKQTHDFIWIAHNEEQSKRKNIIIYKYPVEKGVNMMDAESLIENNKEALKANIPGMRENSYMIHSKHIKPTIQYLGYKDLQFAEMRGLWDLENDYMGGPFIAHVLYSPDGKYMVGVEGFVYAPKYDKLPLLRDVEAIVYSFSWDKEQK